MRAMFLAIAPTIALLASSAWAQSEGPAPQSVVVDPVRRELVQPRREATGELRAVDRSQVASEVRGRIVELPVQEGDFIEQSGMIARLDSTMTSLEVQRAEAEVRRRAGVVSERRVLLEKAQRDVRRIESLMQRSSASQTELDDAISDADAAEARLDQAEAELAVAEAELALLREQLEDLIIQAPFSGRVAERLARVGEWLNAGDPVVELVALEPIDAWIDLPQQFIAELARDDLAQRRRLQIRIDATGEIIEGPLIAALPLVDPLSRMASIRVRVQNERALLRPGMSVIGLIPLGQKEPMLTVHKDAVLRDASGAHVFVAREGVAALTPVNVMFAVGDRLVISPGLLSEGDLVVVEGNERLAAGSPVEIVGGVTPIEARRSESEDQGDA